MGKLAKILSLMSLTGFVLITLNVYAADPPVTPDPACGLITKIETVNGEVKVTCGGVNTTKTDCTYYATVNGKCMELKGTCAPKDSTKIKVGEKCSCKNAQPIKEMAANFCPEPGADVAANPICCTDVTI